MIFFLEIRWILRRMGYEFCLINLIWANYNDLSRGHPKWWLSKGIPPKSPKHSGLGIIVICPDLIEEGIKVLEELRLKGEDVVWVGSTFHPGCNRGK